MMGRMQRADRGRADRGSAAVELVLVAPILVALLLFVVGLGRMAHARGQVDGAAREAARAASLERHPGAAAAAGQRAARSLLAGERITCASLAVSVDVSGYRPGGLISANVSCVASLAGLGLAGFPGSRTFTATATAPIENYRGVP
jgi:Flp pilus assembly protein TadG